MFQIKYVYDLVDKISPQLRTIQSNLKQTASQVETSANKMANSFQAMQKNIKSFGNEARTIGFNLTPLSLGLSAVGIGALKASANFETMQMRMEILTGSAEIGKKLFNDLNKLGAETPFRTEELAKAQNLMMGYGMSIQDAFKNLKILGDISAGSGGDIQGMALALSQVYSTTKLLGQDLNQFVNNGVPLIQLLAKSMFNTDKPSKQMIANIMKLKEEGQISFEMVSKALEKATQKGGKYNEAMKKLSETLSGKLSTTLDYLQISLGKFGDEITKTFELKKRLDEFNVVLNKLAKQFEKLSPETKKWIVYISLFIAIAGPLLIIIGQISLGIMALNAVLALLLANPVVLFVIAIAGAILYFREELTATYNFLKDKFLQVFDWIVLKIDSVINKITQLKNKFLEFSGLGDVFKMFNMVFGNESSINKIEPINQSQPLTAGGQLDINFGNMPKGSSANFTPVKNSFLSYNLGTNSIYGAR